jgi:hypothetical protein
MTDLLKDILDTLNSLPNRKVKGKDFTTYDLVKRVEQELDFQKWLNQPPSNSIEDRTFRK